MDNIRPPIGCPPAWLAADSRIVTLSLAINRQLNADDYEPNYKLIKLWAEEIIAQVNIAEHYKEGIK